MNRTTQQLADIIIDATEQFERISKLGNARFAHPFFEKQHLACRTINEAVKDALASNRKAELAEALRRRGYAKPVGLAAAIMSHVA